MKKLLLGLLLSVGLVMASEAAKDDLLSMATMGKTSGLQTQMSTDEMKDADGGYTFTNSVYYRSIYGYSYYDTGSRYSGYNRNYSNGSTYSWNTTSYGGYTWMAY